MKPVLLFRPGCTVVALCMPILSIAAPVAAQTADRPLYLNEDGLPALAPFLAEVTPAVVNISVESRQTTDLNPFSNDPFFRRFFDMEPSGRRPD